MLMLAIALLCGEQAALLGLAFLLVVGFVSIAASIFITRKLRDRIGKKAYAFPAFLVFALSATVGTLWLVGRPNTGPPVALSGAEAAKLIESLAGTAPFGYSGLAFFQGKLYVTSNVGLLEIEDAVVQRLFRVQKDYSVVSGPWVDSANGLMWILDDQTNELLSFDGQTWRRMQMPTPEKGYYSRGEVLEGIRAVDDGKHLWIQAGGTGWHWDPGQNSWVRSPQPAQVFTEQKVSQIIGVLPLGGQVVWVVRHEALSFLIHDDDFQSDTLVVLGPGGKEKEIPNNSGLRFFAEHWAVSGNVGYICTRKDELLQVTSQEITEIATPAPCEALVRTTTGRLLASFRGKGIYTRNGAWVLRAEHPHPSGTGDYWVYLAGDSETTAIAIHPKPVMASLDPSTSARGSEFVRNAPAGLWISSVAGTREVILSSRP